MLSKPSQNSGLVMAVRLALLSPDPNSRPPELKCSIKVEPSKILEESSGKTEFSKATHERDDDHIHAHKYFW